MSTKRDIKRRRQQRESEKREFEIFQDKEATKFARCILDPEHPMYIPFDIIAAYIGLDGKGCQEFIREIVDHFRDAITMDDFREARDDEVVDSSDYCHHRFTSIRSISTCMFCGFIGESTGFVVSVDGTKSYSFLNI